MKIGLTSAEPADTLTFVGLSFVLAVVALGAALVPAGWASRIDPAEARRAE